MRYLSVCAGIEAASVAWHPLGWVPACFSEIEPFPRAVLRTRWPGVPIHGRDRAKGETFEDHAADAGFQTIGASDYGAIDLLVGGTPCQSFSVAGKRGGMADGRGNLALEYIRLAHRKRPRWLVWENVPGVFSSNGGEDFRCFISGLVRWDVPIPDGGWSNAGVAAAGPADGAFVAHTLDGAQGQAVAINTYNAAIDGDVAHTIPAGGGPGRVPHAMTTAVRRLTPRECERLQGFPDDYTRIAWPGWRDMDPDETPDQCREDGLDVRRTKAGKWRVKDVDGPRYKALGNSMAVPVMRWIGTRIQAVEDLRLNDCEPPESESA